MRALSIALLLVCSAQSACVAHWTVVGPSETVKAAKVAKPADSVPVGIEAHQLAIAMPNHFTITNNTDEIVWVDYTASVIEYLGKSHRVLPGETRKLNSDLAPPPRAIAAKTAADVSFYSDTVDAAIIAQDTTIIFRVALKRDSKSKPEFAVLHHTYQPPDEVKRGERRGEFSADVKEWYKPPLFGAPEPGGVDYDEALEYAEKEYGEDSRIIFAGRTLFD